MDNSTLHHAIMRHFIDQGHAPSIDALMKIFNSQDKDAVISKLVELQDYHGVVLHPTTSEILVAHPFSNIPTNFWVKCPGTGAGKWWGNCGWCSLGIAALVNGHVTITTTLGAEDSQVVMEIEDGKIKSKDDLFVHFPIPMRNAWDHVTYTCSLMLFFDSEIQVRDWCTRHNITKGDVLPVTKIWDFAKVWYGNHLKQDWKKWTTEKAMELFQEFGLIGNIWQLSDTNNQRF